MKKGILIGIIIGILIPIIIWLSIVLTDYISLKTGHGPIFAKITDTYLDGGSYEAHGFGYKICFYTTIYPEKSGTDFEIGAPTMKFDSNKTKVLQNNLTK